MSAHISKLTFHRHCHLVFPFPGTLSSCASLREHEIPGGRGRSSEVWQS